MNRNVQSKRNVLLLMRRLGMYEQLNDAALRLPDPVDTVRDSVILKELGLDFDSIVNQLGGSPW